MKIPQNRMAQQQQRIEPTGPMPAERVMVQPPPEYRLKCPHCGASRFSTSDNDRGTIPKTGENRRKCASCGARLAFDVSWTRVRILG
jgi:transcription elongation factor Elf1